MQDESLNMRQQQARPIRERHGDLIWTVYVALWVHRSLGSLVHAYRNCRKPQDNVKIDDSEHCSRAELLATHVKRLETLHSTS